MNKDWVSRTKTLKDQRERDYKNKEWYDGDSLLGHQSWGANVFILMGARANGKTTWCQTRAIKWRKEREDKNFWLCLTDTTRRDMLAGNGEFFIDQVARDKNGVTQTIVRNRTVFGKVDDKEIDLFTVFDLSTMAKVKNLSVFNYKTNTPQQRKELVNQFGDLTQEFSKNGYTNIFFDEMNREKQERKTFNIQYNLINLVETLNRQNQKVRLFMIGNLLEDGSDVLSLYNFIPFKPGIYKIRHKDKWGNSRKAVIEYIQETETQMAKRRKSMAYQLGGASFSTFNNMVERCTKLITKKRLIKPSYILNFGDEHGKFTVWDNNVITPWSNEKVQTYGMRRHTDNMFRQEIPDLIFQMYDNELLLYNTWMTQHLFRKAMKEIKAK